MNFSFFRLHRLSFQRSICFSVYRIGLAYTAYLKYIERSKYIEHLFRTFNIFLNRCNIFSLLHIGVLFRFILSTYLYKPRGRATTAIFLRRTRR